jgi:predicted nucleotidyltransferase
MIEEKNSTGKPWILNEQKDEKLSWIEKELEEKLWSLYYRKNIKNIKFDNFYSSESLKN